MIKSLRDPWLGVAVGLAVALRLYGLDHGLPHVYNPDEANIMARSLAVAQGLDPGYYLYPSLLFYLLFGVMGGLFVFGRLVGRYDDLGAFQRLFFEDPTDFYLTGRLFGVACAVATIGLTYWLAARHFGKPVARVAALLMAVCYHHVRDAHYIKHDVPAGLVVILTLIALDRAMEQPDKKRLSILGAVVGVGFALHYYMIFLAVLVVVVHLAVHGRRSVSRGLDLVLVGSVASVVFCLMSPFVVIHFPTALEHMSANRQVVVDRSLDAGSWFPSLPAYARFMLGQAYGYGWCLLMLLGFGAMLRSGPRRVAVWFGFVAPFVLFIGYTFFAGRYLNPIVAPLCVAAAVGLGEVARRTGWKIAGAIAIVASVQPAIASLHSGRLFAAPDTRTLAREWVVTQIESGSHLALQSYSVPVPRSARDLRGALESNEAADELDRRGKFSFLVEAARDRKPSYSVTFLGSGDEKDRVYIPYASFQRGLAPLAQRGIRILVLKYPPSAIPPELDPLFGLASTEARLVHRVSPFALAEPAVVTHPYLDNEDWPVHGGLRHKGPLIEIYELPRVPTPGSAP